MARRKEKDRDDDAQRMTVAMRRLEDLLADPGPAAPAKAPAPASEDEPGDETDGDDEQAADSATAKTAPAARRRPLAHKKPAHIWTSKAEAGPKAPPSKPLSAAPAMRRPSAAGEAPQPAASSKLFDAIAARLIGRHDSDIADAIAQSRSAIRALIVFSAAISAAMLAGPVAIMLIVDAVLPLESVQTLSLVALFAAAAGGVIALLELARVRIIARIAAEIEMRLGSSVFEASLRRSLDADAVAPSTHDDFGGVNRFLSGAAPLALLDAPWTFLPLAALVVIDWRLGLGAAFGVAAAITLIALSQQRAPRLLREAGDAGAQSLDIAAAGERHAGAISAMGFLGAYRAHWQDVNAQSVSWRLLASDRLGGLAVAAKAATLALLLAMACGAAYLALADAITPGAAIAATLIFALALAPFDRLAASWRDALGARDSLAKLDATLAYATPDKCRTDLPRPTGAIVVQTLRAAAAGSRKTILSGVDFSLEPGHSLAIVGPTASGKSTLARVVCGLQKPAAGAILLDGIRLDQWRADDLGRHVGYLPQDARLLAGTVAQNIGRFRDDADDLAVMTAAKQAHVHDMIVALPQGYETELGAGGVYLSGGQRQRIALARALFGASVLIVLDEPTSNLDRHGEQAFAAALDGMRLRGQTVVIVSHHAAAIGAADQVLLLDRGRQRAIGPRDEMMALLAGDATFKTAGSATAPAKRAGRAAGR